MKTHPTLILLTTLFLAGCPVVEQWEAQSLTDEGTVCVEGEADATATVTVDSNFCMSSSCDRNETGSCTATLDGSTINVTSSFSWETATGAVACTDDCGRLATTCEVGPLPAGEYTVVHGGDSETVTIPTTEACGWD